MAIYTIDLPDEIAAFFASPEELKATIIELLVMDLLRNGKLSQGRAAELLGVNRWDFLDMIARAGIESGPATAEEMTAELENADRVFRQRVLVR